MIYRNQDLSGHDFRGQKLRALEIWNCNLAGAKWAGAKLGKGCCGHFTLTTPKDSQGEPICAFFFNGQRYVNYKGNTYTFSEFRTVAKKRAWANAVIQKITIDSVFWGAEVL